MIWRLAGIAAAGALFTGASAALSLPLPLAIPLAVFAGVAVGAFLGHWRRT